VVGIFPGRDAIIRLVAPCWPSRTTNGPSPAGTWARKSSPPAQVVAGESVAQLGRGDELVPVVQAGWHEGGHSPVLGQLDHDELADPGAVDCVEQEQPSRLEYPGRLAYRRWAERIVDRRFDISAESAVSRPGRYAIVSRASLSLGCAELPLRLLVERHVGGGEVLLQVRHRGGAGYQQDVGR
jgi:hypothetical protein